jgi:molybdopterin/thiamine biosynthesis adenylyltransferase
MSPSTENQRYARLHKLPFWDPQKVENSLPVVLGAGMTGSHVVLNLATMGFSRIIVIDYDTLAVTDLGKSLYPHKDAKKGRLKVESLKDMVARVNPDTEVETHAMNFSTFPKGVILDEMTKSANLIPLICVDNRATMVQATTFFSALGLKSYMGAVTASQLKSQVWIVDPQKGGCFACSLDEYDFAIMNNKMSCIAGEHPETGVAALNSVAAQCAAGIIHEVLRHLMPGLPRPTDPSYQIAYTPLSGQMLSALPRLENCRYHYPAQSGVLETSLEWTLQSLYDQAASMMNIPVEEVVLSFDFQNKDFCLSNYCTICRQSNKVASLISSCPHCGLTEQIIYGEYTRLLSISRLSAEARIHTLGQCQFAAGELYLCSNTGQNKTILIRVKGH